MASVQVRNLKLNYGATKALDDVTLGFPEGQLFGLLGPSGSGKTTLLRCIAGFIFPDSGTVEIGGQTVEHIPVERRDIGMMFQNYALFPNMSVADNIGFGLKVRRVSAAERKRRVDEVLDLVKLGGLSDRRPHQLSGGQKQRVALARAIITRPKVLLLDEPLSALDKALRSEMQIELKRIQREVGITTIFVTHDQEEAMTLSDRIGVLREGKLIQEGPAQEIYRAPVDLFTATFLGDANVIDGAVGGGDKKTVIRPEMISISRDRPTVDPNSVALSGRLEQVVSSGPTTACFVAAKGITFKVLMLSHEAAGLTPGSDVWISWQGVKAIELMARDQ